MRMCSSATPTTPQPRKKQTLVESSFMGSSLALVYYLARHRCSSHSEEAAPSLSFEVSTLKKAGYVTGDLAFGQTKFMGVCRRGVWRLKEVQKNLVSARAFQSGNKFVRLSRGHLHRRLDIRCMPEDQYHFGSSVARSRLVEPANIDRLL